MNNTMPLRSLVAGVLTFALVLGSWLYGEILGIDTSVLWPVAVPVILGLLVGEVIGNASRNSAQAAQQTNGVMDDRIKASVASALADRDAARTRQSRGDIEDKPKRIIESEDTHA